MCPTGQITLHVVGWVWGGAWGVGFPLLDGLPSGSAACSCLLMGGQGSQPGVNPTSTWGACSHNVLRF